MRQRGFIELSLLGWAAISASALIVLLGVGLKIQTSRLDAVKAEYEQFRAGVKVIGEQAQVRKVEIELADKQRKERSDAENKRTIAALDADNQRLRNLRPSGGFVPEAPADARRPDVITFDRAEFRAAVGRLIDGVRGVVEEGDKARVDMDSARRWAAP